MGGGRSAAIEVQHLRTRVVGICKTGCREEGGGDEARKVAHHAAAERHEGGTAVGAEGVSAGPQGSRTRRVLSLRRRGPPRGRSGGPRRRRAAASAGVPGATAHAPAGHHEVAPRQARRRRSTGRGAVRARVRRNLVRSSIEREAETATGSRAQVRGRPASEQGAGKRLVGSPTTAIRCSASSRLLRLTCRPRRDGERRQCRRRSSTAASDRTDLTPCARPGPDDSGAWPEARRAGHSFLATLLEQGGLFSRRAFARNPACA